MEFQLFLQDLPLSSLIGSARTFPVGSGRFIRSVAPEMMNAIQSHQRQLTVDDCAIQPPTMGENVVPSTRVNKKAITRYVSSFYSLTKILPRQKATSSSCHRSQRYQRYWPHGWRGWCWLLRVRKSNMPIALRD